MIGACWFGFNAPGCFLWADVEASGRLRVVSDLKFQHQSPEQVAADVHARTRELGVLKLSRVVAAPEMFPKEKPDIQEAEAPSEGFARFGLPMVATGSNHTHGWQRIHDYLRLAPDGKPWLVIEPACTVLIRAFPSIVQSDTDPEDVKGSEVYALHALRVLVSSRPAPSALLAMKPKPKWGTLGWLKSLDDKPNRRGVLAR